MKFKDMILGVGIMAALGTGSHATIIGFGQLGGSNTAVPGTLGSRASSDGNGYVVTNGTTPNIVLGWDGDWDIHTSSWFNDLEAKTAGGGSWDNEGGVPRIGQLDSGNHTITFTADPGYALVLDSFDFVHTEETSGSTTWELTLRNVLSSVVWSQTVTLDNQNNSHLVTVAPNFTGTSGETYTLSFNRVSESYGSNGRHAIDNLSFSQIEDVGGSEVPLDPIDLIDPLVGAEGRGYCVPGACLPQSSIYPSPDTVAVAPSGYVSGSDVVGFSQLHASGAGASQPSFGNFLISPQLGAGIDESDHASPIANVEAKPYSYRADLSAWSTGCTVVPAANSAIYEFEFPSSDDARLYFDVARKLGRSDGMTSGSVAIDPINATISGGGTFDGNWNPAPYEVYFFAKVDTAPSSIGTWTGSTALEGVATASIASRQRLGGWMKFDTTGNSTVRVKIAVSFVSVAQAEAHLNGEIPGWDLVGLEAAAKTAWEQAIAPLAAPGISNAEGRKLYTALFHSLIQPRDRSADRGWTDAPFVDDQYTLWDTWQTLFPLLAIVRPDSVADSVNSFAERYVQYGRAESVFIQGEDFQAGQGGDEVEQIIADALAKDIPGIDWPKVWNLLEFTTGRRTEHYKTLGYVSTDGGTNGYGWRMQSGSSTLAFAHGDWCAAQVADSLGHSTEAQALLTRSQSWRNLWDSTASGDGFRGFIRARASDGNFSTTAPASNGGFYQGTAWNYSFNVPHERNAMIALAGGRPTYIERLEFALNQGSNAYVDFTNEVCFQFIWQLCHANRPYLASYWADQLRQLYGHYSLPGDEDSGAMSSLYFFATAGFFPCAGEDFYYLHGPVVPELQFTVDGGNTFTITAENAGGPNLYVQSATLDGQPLEVPVIHHSDILAGSTLAFVMGPNPSSWGTANDFIAPIEGDLVVAAEQWSASLGAPQISGANTDSPTWGSGADDADNTAIASEFPAFTLHGERDSITLSATVEFSGLATSQSAPASRFSWGLFDSNGSADTSGWIGLSAANDTTDTDGTHRFWKKPAGNATPWHDFADATALASHAIASPDFIDGSYELLLSVTRNENGGLDYMASLLRPADGVFLASFTGTDSSPDSFTFDRVGLRAGDVLDADSIQVTACTLTCNSNDVVGFSENPITEADAEPGVAYSGSLAGYVFDPDADTLSFSKAAGPSWLHVGTDGTLSGTPAANDRGTNEFLVSVSDDDGSATAVLIIEVNNPSATGGVVWTGNGDGSSWYDDANWDFSNSWITTMGPTGSTVLDDLLVSNANITSSYSGNLVLGDGFTLTLDNASFSQTPSSGGLSGVNEGTDLPSNLRLTHGSSWSSQWCTVGVDIHVDGTSTFRLKGGGDALNSQIEQTNARLSAGGKFVLPSRSEFDEQADTSNGAIYVEGERVSAATMAAYFTFSGTGPVIATAVNPSPEGAPSFDSDPIAGADAQEAVTYTGTLAGSATDPDADPLTFSKISGPVWLQVAPEGGLSGTPSASDVGANAFVVGVTDNKDGSDTAILNLYVHGTGPSEPTGYGSVWKYLDDGSNQGTSWRDATFDDSSWASGSGQLGYGDGDESTALSGNLITYYFRRSFRIDDASGVDTATFDLLYDDGAILYLNGVEIHRTSLMPSSGEVAYDEPTSSALGSENTVDSGIAIDTALFVDGSNVLAVEVHNSGTSSSDISFDLDLELVHLPEGSPRFAEDPIIGPLASATHPYSGSLMGTASDPDSDPMSYAKVSGPEWLLVAADGTLSGTPLVEDIGISSFEVSVTDNQDGTDTATLTIQVNDENGNPPDDPDPSATEQIRLIWLDDPTSTVTVAWTQGSGSAATVKYGPEDLGRSHSLYPHSKSVDVSRTYSSSGSITTQFAALSGLQADTVYYFVLVDESGTSDRYWFRTAPAVPQAFTFIAGGDSRNNRTPRQKANRMVAKLRPLFVAFTGDMIDADNATQWDEWLSDWEQSVSEDGRMYPILPHRGNHESRGNGTLVDLFNAPSGNYYSLDFGGSLLRYYVLNSESGEGTQADWLQGDLDAAGGMHAYTHLMAGYHKPMRPHTSGKSEGSAEYSNWAQLFYDNRFDLVFESDSHVMKRTAPLRPETGTGSDEGFITDVVNGTVYTGEGCWGAPLRSTDDNKDWTTDAESFNGFDLVHVYPDYVELFSVKVDNESISFALEEGDEFSLPAGIELWEAAGGTRLVVNRGEVAPLSYAQYQLDTFGSMPPIDSDVESDFDSDGKDNYTEYVFGTDASTVESPSPTEHYPHIVVGSEGEKLLRHRLRIGVTSQVEYWITEDLNSWRKMAEGIDYTLETSDGSGYVEIELEMIGSNALLEKVFVRVGY
ncbi:GH92 family glycosyl hydrolase [Haloferula chungangensis]|uniref:GH92 family glycosyl hydrolase n=1 Tax=Haloferula chungangensis TaxID=1048331 RepID=A0ABW2L812_9BACT